MTNLRQPLNYKLWSCAKSRSQKSGIAFAITKYDIRIPANCPICDTPLQEAFGRVGGNAASPTLDRVRNTEGYVKGNIAVICKKCNARKSDATAAELRHMADWMDTFG